MTKRFLPLAVALAALLGFVLMAAVRSETRQPPVSACRSPVAEPAALQIDHSPRPASGDAPDQVAPELAPSAPSAPANPATPAEAAAEPQPEPTQPPVKTGCGKAAPCPNRSCEDCPFNIYLR